jgi:hypothetical protein
MAIDKVEITLPSESWGSYPDIENVGRTVCPLYIARRQGRMLVPVACGTAANTKLASCPILIIRHKKNY